MKENRKERNPTRLDMIREYQASRDRKQRRSQQKKRENQTSWDKIRKNQTSSDRKKRDHSRKKNEKDILTSFCYNDMKNCIFVCFLTVHS